MTRLEQLTKEWIHQMMKDLQKTLTN